MDATQLLHNNSFICFAIMAPVAPFIDWINSERWVLDEEYSMNFVGIICLSGAIALGLNLACFLIIGAAGPITFQVVGYFKTVLVFTGGVFIFNEGISVKKGLGVLISILGLVYYTHVKRKIQAENRPETNLYQRQKRLGRPNFDTRFGLLHARETKNTSGKP